MLNSCPRLKNQVHQFPYLSIKFRSNFNEQGNLFTVKEVQQHAFPRLDHPEEIFYLRRSNPEFEERWIYSTPDHYFSEELVLRGGIIRDHRSAGYKAAFENTKP